jgi:hypothetical protein
MIPMPAKGLVAFAISCCAPLGIARAADPMPATTQLVAASTAAVTAYGTSDGKPLPFTIATPQDLVVTLNFVTPAGAGYGPPLSAGVVVTQAGAIAAQASLATPATSATASIPAASGDYRLYVFGAPDANTGRSLFTVCVAPKASPSNCISTASLSGIITAQSTGADPTVSTLLTNLVVSAPGGAYTFTFGDLQFPGTLNVPPTLALFQGITPICPPGQSTPAGCTNAAITSGTVMNLPAGTYQLLALAQADQTSRAGLYGITVTGGASGAAPLLDIAVPVGLITAATSCTNPTAQSVSLKVTDYGFPGLLASASALLTAGGTALGTANATGGSVSFAAPAAPSGSTPLYLWTYASAGTTAGTFSVDVAGAADLCTTAQGVLPSGATSSYAYAFVTPTLSAGAYQATAADLQFPSQLTGLSFWVAQNSAVLQKSATAGTVSFNAAAGPAILLVSAQTPAGSSASGNGLFDVNVQSAGASAQLQYDKTQSVSSSGALFDSQTLTIGVSGSFDVSLTDLKFPDPFANLALAVSRGSEVLGKIYGGGPFTFSGTPGTYQLTFVATPSAQQQFGLYGVSVVFSPPVITLSSGVSTAVTGTVVQLSWNAVNATSCSASGGTWSGSKATSMGTESVALDATTTYTLTCVGAGGTSIKTVSVTATPKPASSSGGGGALGLGFLALGGALVGARLRRCRYAGRAAGQGRDFS